MSSMKLVDARHDAFHRAMRLFVRPFSGTQSLLRLLFQDLVSFPHVVKTCLSQPASAAYEGKAFSTPGPFVRAGGAVLSFGIFCTPSRISAQKCVTRSV